MKNNDKDFKAVEIFNRFKEESSVSEEESELGFSYVCAEDLADKVLNFIATEKDSNLANLVKILWHDSIQLD